MCAAYYNYFAALTQILCAPCNTEEISGRCHFPLPATPQEPMVVLPIRRPLTLVPPSLPRRIWSVRSVRLIQTASSQFLPIYQLLHKKPIFLSKLERTNMIQRLLWREPQQVSYNAAGEYNLFQSSPSFPDLLESPSRLTNTHTWLPQLPQHPYFIPLYGKNSHTGMGRGKFLAAEAARKVEKSDEGASAVNVE